MKRCPKCRTRYSDDSLNFCLDDGSPLYAEPEAAPTLVSPARPTMPWTEAPSSLPQSSRSRYRWVLHAAIIVLAVMLGGGAVAFLFGINKWYSPADSGASKAPTATPETKLTKTVPEKSATPATEPTPSKALNLTGEWSLVNTIEETSYPQYANLRLGYRITINQTGTEFTADGEKVSENGRPMDVSERTPIHVTGSVDQDVATATFVEEGLRRKTTGRFVWTIAADGNHLRGTFVSTAAKSSGSSVAVREK